MKYQNKKSETFDILYVSKEPKWRFFRPPLFVKIWKWEISFTWAYHIHEMKKFKDCYPISMDTKSNQEEVTLNFYSNPVITESNSTLQKYLETWKQGLEE